MTFLANNESSIIFIAFLSGFVLKPLHLNIWLGKMASHAWQRESVPEPRMETMEATEDLTVI